jgi:hypothetical protein
MSIDLKVYDNGDHTCLVWLPEDARPIPNCRGFCIRRLQNGQQSYLHGFVGFTDTDKLDPAAPWKFPLQRYMWWDYLVKPGDKVQYSVVPVVGPKDSLALDTENASGLTPEMEITGQSTPHVSAYFNKGIVAAQWVSRALAAEPKNSKIKDLVAKPGDPLRDELSGLLRPNILSLLANARKENNKIFAALYELNDLELIGALTAFGTDCNLILPTAPSRIIPLVTTTKTAPCVPNSRRKSMFSTGSLRRVILATTSSSSSAILMARLSAS